MDFTLTADTDVDAPVDSVYRVITDIDRLPEWNKEIGQVHESPEAMGPGAQWVVEIHAMGTHWRSRSEVVEVDAAGGVFAYRSVSDDGNPSFADWRWELTPTDEGRTHVVVAVSANPRTFWRRYLLSNLRPPVLRAAMDRSLRALGNQVAVR